ncbi:MAG: aldehyde dehydrogenase family protein [Burkholderiaceae bacterium]
MFAGVRPSLKIARDEVFGPVLAVIPFDSEEEAIDIANGTDSGLVAGVFTQGLNRALRLSRPQSQPSSAAPSCGAECRLKFWRKLLSG